MICASRLVWMPYRCLWCNITTKWYSVFIRHHKSVHPDAPLRVRYEGKACSTYNGSKTLKLYVPLPLMKQLGVEGVQSYTLTVANPTRASKYLILRLYP